MHFSEEEQLRWEKIQQDKLLHKLPHQLQLLITLINPSNESEWHQLPAIGEGLKKELEQSCYNTIL